MEALLIIALIFVATLVTVGPVLFIKLRNITKTNLDYERAMEMVPVIIHLPPSSEDTDTNGRDVRDVVDENISKAQIIYNIISSTTEKGIKNRWYGQRHFSFEIVGVKGFVYLYAAVPADMLDVLRQAITSAYPSTRLEVAHDHNIFSEVGGAVGVMGGEFNLKESFAYPIATYQDLKRDAFQSLLNALSALETADGAAIQILFRPADASWRKQAHAHASSKRKGDDKGAGIAVLARQVVTALVKPPEHKEDGGSSRKELSSLEQSIVDSIDDKTRYAGFEVTIRAIASSNISQRSQAIINNIAASFSLFDSPGRNGFKFEPAKDPGKLAADFMLRTFPHRSKRNVMNSVELATLFHFPDQRNVPTSQLSRQESKQVDGPRNMPEKGLLLGFNVFRGVKKPIRVDIKDRQRHMYAVGQTGTGKSTFLENLALQDMLNGDGFAFVDPHGDTVEKLLAMVPKERTEDVIYFCPADMTYPMGLNLFEYNNPDQKDFLIQEVINMLYKLYDPQHQGIMGPRYESIFRNAALAVMADPNGGTFVDIPKLFRDPEFLKQKLQHVTDPNVLDYWQKEYPAAQRSNDAGEITAWFVSKFGAFLSNEMMRNIIGQTKSAFDLREIMDNKKILLVNLSKGRTGDLNSKLLGMIFVMKFQAAAMSRSNIPEDQRQDFALYVDEFQNFSTDSFATIMSEARKYHLNLIVANQFTTQLTEEIRDAVFGNIGTIVSFRIGQNDVDSLSRYFQPTFDGEDLLRVPNANTIVRTLVNGVPTQPFSMATLPPLGNPNPGLADALKQLSAAKYGKPRAVVEKEIFGRLATHPATPKPFQNPFASPAPGGSAQAFGNPTGQPLTASAAISPKPAAPSFLDEWKAKQRAKAPTPVISPAPQTRPTHAEVSHQPTPKPVATPAPTAAPASHGVSERPTLTHAAPTLTPQAFQVSAKPDAAGNVSSAQIDQQEIDDIAAELKKELKPVAPVPTGKPPKTASLKPQETKPIAKPPKDESATPKSAAAELEQTTAPVLQSESKSKSDASQDSVGEAQLKPQSTTQVEAELEEDTIFIDSEGKFHVRNADEEVETGAKNPTTE